MYVTARLIHTQEMRQQGIATALIQAVYEAADINGTPSVYWMTQNLIKKLENYTIKSRQ